MEENIVKKEKKITFKLGERVKIITPEQIVRIGYPLDKQEVIKNLITLEEKDAIASLLGLKYQTKMITGECVYQYEWTHYANNVFDKIIDNLAYYKLKINNFGGKERKIFTKLTPENQDKIGTVIGKKVVRTGNYYAPSSRQTYEGEYDCSPGGLENAKCHLILQIDLFSTLFLSEMFRNKYSYGFWIEAKNVIKHKDDEII